MKLPKKVKDEFREIEGSIDYAGNGSELLKELRKEEK